MEESSKEISGEKLSWRQIFKSYDVRNLDTLTALKIIEAFVNELGIPIKDALTVAKDIDEDRNGTVTLEEWMAKSVKFLDNVDRIKDVVMTFDEFKEIMYVRLLNGTLIWEALFIDGNPERKSKSVLGFAEELKWRLDLPRDRIFDLMRCLDIHKTGFISYQDWISAYENPTFRNDKHRFLLRSEGEDDKYDKIDEFEYVFNKDHFKIDDGGLKDLDKSGVSGLSDIMEGEDEDENNGEGRHVIIHEEVKDFKDGSLNFKDFIKKSRQV